MKINKLVCIGRTKEGRVFVRISFNDELSITGVIGPKSNGDCNGSAGQCYDSLHPQNFIEYYNGWSADTVSKLIKVWEEWHLNDMHAECSHQKDLGWLDIGKKEVTIYHYMLRTDIWNTQNKFKEIITNNFVNDISFTPEEKETMRYIVSLPLSITTHDPEIIVEEYYKLDKKENKTLGWLTEKEHPEGILSKSCPVCGYKYGSSWLIVEVPKDVIEWLSNLPDSEYDIPGSWLSL